MAEFKDRLKALRAQKDISQRELAEILNISKSAVSMYESGQRQPDFETLEIIADYFNVDIDYIMGRSDTTHKYMEVRADGHPVEYYEDATVQRVAEKLRTNPKSRVAFDALSTMKNEDIEFVQKLIERMSG